MDKKAVLSVIGALVLLLVAMFIAKGVSREDNWICQDGVWVKHGNPSAPMPTGTCEKGTKQASPTTQAGLPNPAAKYCIDNGGSQKALKETAGDIGVCQFKDNSQCEEWKFYRGECKSGQTITPDLSHAYSGIIKKTGSLYTFNSNGTTYQLIVLSNTAKEVSERLTLEAKNGKEVIIVAEENPLLSKNLILRSFQEK